MHRSPIRQRGWHLGWKTSWGQKNVSRCIDILWTTQIPVPWHHFYTPRRPNLPSYYRFPPPQFSSISNQQKIRYMNRDTTLICWCRLNKPPLTHFLPPQFSSIFNHQYIKYIRSVAPLLYASPNLPSYYTFPPPQFSSIFNHLNIKYMKRGTTFIHLAQRTPLQISSSSS